MSNDIRDDFEVAYIAQMAKHGIDGTTEGIKVLRNGGTYSDADHDRNYLDGCWAGWKMAQAAKVAA